MSRDDYSVKVDLGDGVVRDKYDVSIIIPAYVDEKYKLDWFEECLHSAVKNDAFVVVVDDNSPIDLLPLRANFGIHVNWYSLDKRSGVSVTRNVAAIKAKTKFIFPLDCDDTLSIGAIGRLLDNWKGVPVYPDVLRYNYETRRNSHYMLKDFDCSIITKHVAIASVGVLHTREQWEAIGGWNETLDLFEDGEYNARLMMRYCGVHYAEPLYHYRIHPEQKTSKYNKAEYDKIMKSVLGIIRSLPMACPSCRGKNRGNLMFQNQNKSMDSVPGESEDKVLAQYIGGKGKGWHYYRGKGTNFAYKVTHGQHLHVHPDDADLPNARVKTKLFVVVQTDDNVTVARPDITVVDALVAPKSSSAPIAQPSAVSTLDAPPVQASEVTQLAVDEDDDEYEEYEEDDELPDISNMTVGELREWDFDMETVAELLEMERQGKNRKSAIEYLRSLIDENRVN